MKIIIAVFAVVLATTPALASNWKYIAYGRDGMLVYIDLQSARRSGDVVTVWVKHDLSKVATDPARDSKMLKQVDCSSRTLTQVSSTDYRADGSVLRTHSLHSSLRRTSPVVPDTVGENLLKLRLPVAR